VERASSPTLEITERDIDEIYIIPIVSKSAVLDIASVSNGIVLCCKENPGIPAIL
jgi:hypothetical protein